MPTKVFLVAGEASADFAGAGLVKELKKLAPQCEYYGVGGKRLEEQGMQIVVSAETINVVGISDWLDKAKDILGAYRKVIKTIEKNRPDFAVLLDLPDFNLRLAKKLKKMGVPVVYYLSPQVWAWRKGRIKQIKENIDQMLVVFPFEREFYEKEGVKVEFVGHPLLESLPARKRYRDQAVIQKSPRIAILPGSRKSEIRYHAPIVRDLIKRIRTQFPEAQIQVPVASTLPMDRIKKDLSLSSEEVVTNSWDSLNWADLAVVASGTATLEAALIGTPFCLFYRVSNSSGWIFKNVIKYQGFIGMPNILLGRQVVKEMFQKDATADKIFNEIKYLVNSGPARLNMVSALLSCRQILGEKGAHLKAAQRVFDLIKRNAPAHS